MPLLKDKLTHLSITKVEVVGDKTGQQKNLEELFLEQGFMMFVDPTGSAIIRSNTGCGPSCDTCCHCDGKVCNA